MCVCLGVRGSGENLPTTSSSSSRSILDGTPLLSPSSSSWPLGLFASPSAKSHEEGGDFALLRENGDIHTHTDQQQEPRSPFSLSLSTSTHSSSGRGRRTRRGRPKANSSSSSAVYYKAGRRADMVERPGPRDGRGELGETLYTRYPHTDLSWQSSSSTAMHSTAHTARRVTIPILAAAYACMGFSLPCSFSWSGRRTAIVSRQREGLH